MTRYEIARGKKPKVRIEPLPVNGLTYKQWAEQREIFSEFERAQNGR